MTILTKDIGNQIVYSDGRIYSKRLKRFYKLVPDKRGYVRVDIQKNKKVRLHRLIAECFIQNPENKPQINHINGIRHDNRIENLEWVTPSENQKHSYKIGLSKPKIGENNNAAKLSNSDVVLIRKALKEGYTQKHIAYYFDVSISAISMLNKNQNWATI